MATNDTQTVRRRMAAGRIDLEWLLLESLDSGVSKLMTAAHKKRIYRQALAGPQPFDRLLRRLL